MTREVGGRRGFRTRTVPVVLAALLAGAMLAGAIGTASAAPADGPGRGGDRDSAAEGGQDTGARAEGTPCSAEARACVDRTGRKAWLIKDGVVEAGPVPAAPGGQGQPTPLGTFEVEWKHQDHRSAEFDNAPMPYAVFFAPGGIAFHEGNVDSPSAGCVRLAREDAARWFESLEVGDRVEIHE